MNNKGLYKGGGACAYLLDLLSWVQGERVLREADLQVGVAKFSLTRLVKTDLLVITTSNRVDDHAVVTRRNHDHPDRREQDPEDGKVHQSSV